MKLKWTKTFLNSSMAMLSILMLIPLIWVIIMSFKNTQEIIMTSAFSLPKTFRYENYIEAWVTGMIGDYFFNSVYITSVTTVFVIVFGTMFGYSLSRLRWKMKNFFFTLILLGLMIPVHATLIPLFVILKNLGLLNSALCLILPYIASGLPMAVYIFRNFLIGIPKEMEEAAFIDGCGIFRSFVSVIIPTIRPAIATVVILTFMHFWNEFVLASTVVKKKAFSTLPIGLQNFQSEFTVNWGAMSAGVVVSVIPVFIAYMVFNDIIEKSVVSGALK